MKNIVAVIPARYQSSRFLGKPLVMIAGKLMIQRVYEQVKKSERISRVIVATDDKRIYNAVHQFQGEVVMTGECSCGTERVYEVVRHYLCDIVINIQGDEPLIKPEMIDELVAEFDDELMNKYLEGEEIPVELLKRAIRKGTLAVEFFPVMCGTALGNTGVKLLLDAVVDYLPAPSDIPSIKGVDMDGKEIERKPSDSEPFSALAFKVMTDPFVGRLTFFRVYSGHITGGSYVINATKGEKERLGRILLMHANNRTEISEVFAGDIAAAVGFKNTTTGDTLCDEKHPCILESMEFPEPVIELTVEPKSKADQDKMGIALQKLAEEDPTFRASTNHETGQTIIAGMGELHLDIIVDRMKREFGVEANVGQPQVSYRETLTQAAECEGKYIKQSGGRGQYGHVWIKFEPNPDKGYEFVDAVVGGVVPRE